jgi:hypothetical protein
VNGTGVTVLMLFSEVGDHLSHDVEKVVLKIFEVEGVDIVRALLNHYGACGVVRNDSNGTVLNAGVLNHFKDLLSDVVEGGDPTSGLKLELFLINLEFHNKFLLLFYKNLYFKTIFLKIAYDFLP